MSVSPRLRAVIFDFGGVLVRTRSQDRRIDWERRLGLARGEAEALVFGGESGTAAQRGQITDEAHWRWLGERLALPPAELARFRDDFFADDVLDTSLVAYIDRLRAAGYHLGLLSNASDIARRVFAETYGVLARFDSVTISCEEGVMKPDPRIYRVALQRAGAQAEEAVFVDDVSANIQGARRVGMRGVHFQSGEQAIADLAALTGIPPDAL
jgi:putative hydrolase of the HAD superfamily